MEANWSPNETLESTGIRNQRQAFEYGLRGDLEMTRNLRRRLTRLEGHIAPMSAELSFIRVVFGNEEASEQNSFVVQIDHNAAVGKGKFRRASDQVRPNSVR